MTNPFNPIDPPNDTTGRTPKMLAGYKTGGINNGAPIPPNNPPRVIIPPEDLTFRAASRFGLRLNNMPAGLSVYFPYQRRKYNRAAYTHIRIGVDVYTAGSAGSALMVQYTTTPLDDGSWLPVGRAGANVFVYIDEVGPWVSDAIEIFGVADITNDLLTDVWWRVVGVGGDGATSPVVGLVYVQFLLSSIRRDRWFWRNITPSIGIPDPPTTQITTLEQLETFWGPQGRIYVSPWSTPSPATVQANPKSFVRSKGNNLGISWGTTVPDDSSNHSGPVFILMGAPLKAQRIPYFDYQTAFCGVGGSGFAACHLSLQLHLWRPSTGEFIRSSPIMFGGAGWFRYIPKAWVRAIPMGDVPMCALGDRYVMYGSTCMELTGGLAASTGGIGTNINYDGGIVIEDHVGDASSIYNNFAAYTDFPLLQYDSETP